LQAVAHMSTVCVSSGGMGYQVGMQSLASRLELKLPAVPESVATARHAAARLANEVGASELDVKIAISEAVGNVIVHAYRDRDPGTIEIEGSVEDDKLLIIVADHGIGMSPNPDSPGLGFGLPLIGQVVEDLHVEAGRAGTRISMAFPLAEPDY
jgi:serine/threonine-protein kinase RsbW